MAFSVFQRVSVSAVSVVVPPACVQIDDELQYYEGDIVKARRFSAVSGLVSRRVASEETTSSDLCIQAAENLFARYHMDREGIEALVFVSHSPDYLLPASAAIQQQKLGLSQRCAVMDMNIGCTGFVQGLWVASGLIESGACSRVLLLVGDTPSRFQNPANRIVGPVFGDAGTATLLERSDSARPMSFLLGSDGAKHESLIIPGGGARIPPAQAEGHDAPYNGDTADSNGNPWSLGGYGHIWMDSMAIFSLGVSLVPRHIRQHMNLLDKKAHDLDALLLHQANRVIMESITKKVGMDTAKVPQNVLSLYGNLGASSLPVVICDSYGGQYGCQNAFPGEAQAGSLDRGQRDRYGDLYKSTRSAPSDILPDGHCDASHENASKTGSFTGTGLARSEVMLCAFGAGASWGSCVLTLEQTEIVPVKEFVEPENPMTRNDRIAYWHKKFSAN